MGSAILYSEIHPVNCALVILWKSAARRTVPAALAMLVVLLPVRAEPFLQVVEAETMRGLESGATAEAGPGWRLGPGRSRLGAAVSDAGADPAVLTGSFSVPSNGAYRLWVAYGCHPLTNAAVAVSLRRRGLFRREVFRETYGLAHAPGRGADTGQAVEGYPVRLKRGRYTLKLAKTANPEPAGNRSIDVVLLTSADAAPVTPDTLPDDLRLANRLFIRFRAPAEAAGPVRLTWRLPGRPETGSSAWPQIEKPLLPGQASEWLDIGPWLPVDRAAVLRVEAAAGHSFGVEVALAPRDKAVLKTFTGSAGAGGSAFLLQPDLKTEEGRAWSRPTDEMYRALADALNRVHRKADGPPARLRIFGAPPGDPAADPAWSDPPGRQFREALGMTDAARDRETRWCVSRLTESAWAPELDMGRLKSAHKPVADPAPRLGWAVEPAVDADPVRLEQAAVSAWGQGAKDFAWLTVAPMADAEARGFRYRAAGPLLAAMRRIADRAALVERWLAPAKAVDASVALLFSGAEAHEAAARDAYAALRLAGHRVDLITEADARNGYLPRYKGLAVCCEIRDNEAVEAVDRWEASGGLRLCASNAAVLADRLAEAGIRPDIRVNAPAIVCNRLTGSEGTVVTMVNLGAPREAGAAPLRLEIDGVTRVGRVWSYAFPQGLETDQAGNTLTILMPRVESTDLVIIEK